MIVKYDSKSNERNSIYQTKLPENPNTATNLLKKLQKNWRNKTTEGFRSMPVPILRKPSAEFNIGKGYNFVSLDYNPLIHQLFIVDLFYYISLSLYVNAFLKNIHLYTL